MDAAWVSALILGLIEGLTEFLPISSTGHLILAEHWLGFSDPSGSFKIAIQLGAILAICLIYFGRLWGVVTGLFHHRAAQVFALYIVIAFMPAAVLGVMFHKTIKTLLFSPLVVAVMLIVGGVIMIIVERMVRNFKVFQIEDLGWKRALGIGFAQSLAMIPGTSRSGATIVGALALGVERKVAAEFSFFLALPTMLGATVYDLYANRDLLTWSEGARIGIGFVAAFIAALIVVKPFLAIITRYGFTGFAIYRILLGGVILFALIGVPGASR